jgi:hypothetical protein
MLAVQVDLHVMATKFHVYILDCGKMKANLCAVYVSVLQI